MAASTLSSAITASCGWICATLLLQLEHPRCLLCPRTPVTHVPGPYTSPKKVSKERRPLLSASLRFATGNLRCSTPAGVRRTRFAQTAAALIPPPSALLGAYRRGCERATFASLGPNSQ